MCIRDSINSACSSTTKTSCPINTIEKPSPGHVLFGSIPSINSAFALLLQLPPFGDSDQTLSHCRHSPTPLRYGACLLSYREKSSPFSSRIFRQCVVLCTGVVQSSSVAVSFSLWFLWTIRSKTTTYQVRPSTCCCAGYRYVWRYRFTQKNISMRFRYLLHRSFLFTICV